MRELTVRVKAHATRILPVRAIHMCRAAVTTDVTIMNRVTATPHVMPTTPAAVIPIPATVMEPAI